MNTILARLARVKAKGVDKKGRNNWEAMCPAHDASSPKLLITEDTDRALFYCRSGCSQTEIMQALAGLGLTGKDLNWDRDWNPKQKPVFTDYHELMILIGEADIAKGKRLSAADKAGYKDALLRRALSA